MQLTTNGNVHAQKSTLFSSKFKCSAISITEIVRVLTHKDSVQLKLRQNLDSVFYVIVADLRYLQYLFNTLLGWELFK